MIPSKTGLAGLVQIAMDPAKHGLYASLDGSGFYEVTYDDEAVSVHVVLEWPSAAVLVGFTFLRSDPASALRVIDVLVHRWLSLSDQGLTAKGVRDLPLGELMSRARGLAVEELEASDQRDPLARRLLPSGGVAEAWELFDESDQDALGVWLEDRRGKGKRQESDYAVLAVLYSRLLERGVRNVAQVLGEATGASSRVTSSRLRKARDLGFLQGDASTAEARTLAAPLLWHLQAR